MLEDEEGQPIETCPTCGEYHIRPECAPVQTCGCGATFRSYLGTKCLICALRDLPIRFTRSNFGSTFARPQVAQPKRQAVPDAFYKAFE